MCQQSVSTQWNLLGWSQHVHVVHVPLTCLKTIYFAMIHSHLNYGIEIYANTYNSFLEPLVKIINKILRILQNKHLRQ